MGQYYQVVFLSEDGKSIIFAIHPHDFSNGAKLGEHSKIYNSLMNTVEALLSPEGYFYKSRIVWAGDYALPEPENTKNLYLLAEEKKEEFDTIWASKPKYPENISEYKYIVNHSKNLYIEINKELYDDYWEIHPLPYMVCDGEGRIGKWARDIISMEKEKPEGFTQYLFSK